VAISKPDLKTSAVNNTSGTQSKIRRTGLGLRELTAVLQALEKVINLTPLNLDALPGHGLPARLCHHDPCPWLIMSFWRCIVWVTIMIVDSLNIKGRGRVVQKKATFSEIFTDDGNIALGSVNKHLER